MKSDLDKKRTSSKPDHLKNSWTKQSKPTLTKASKLPRSLQQLIELARKMREEQKRGTELNLTEEEVAFYDALADNESAKEVLGDKTLKIMAQ